MAALGLCTLPGTECIQVGSQAVPASVPGSSPLVGEEDCDSYCKASKGKLKINMKKYCKKDYDRGAQSLGLRKLLLPQQLQGARLQRDLLGPRQGSTHGVLGASPAREEGLLCVEGLLPTAVAEPLRGGPAEETEPKHQDQQGKLRPPLCCWRSQREGRTIASLAEEGKGGAFTSPELGVRTSLKRQMGDKPSLAAQAQQEVARTSPVLAPAVLTGPGLRGLALSSRLSRLESRLALEGQASAEGRRGACP
ncbi:hypothetical protein J1605_008746 [Eschrichtius robustus]|uniref:Uncharacterized protein n=1 Tax=Eschrichtius robustus TaxID=9764 RepID=A0AB34GWR9_ESCRO|nr:hypothetical protein J1605_008746 [Eschrichtius robustus]